LFLARRVKSQAGREYLTNGEVHPQASEESRQFLRSLRDPTPHSPFVRDTVRAHVNLAISRSPATPNLCQNRLLHRGRTSRRRNAWDEILGSVSSHIFSQISLARGPCNLAVYPAAPCWATPLEAVHGVAATATHITLSEMPNKHEKSGVCDSSSTRLCAAPGEREQKCAAERETTEQSPGALQWRELPHQPGRL
jgi:hypothetical protein